MDNMSDEDISRDVRSNIILYNGSPVYVANTHAGGVLELFDPFRKPNVGFPAPFDVKTCEPPALRLGMVNTTSGAVYVARCPIRRYYYGIHQKNLSVLPLAGAFYTAGSMKAQMEASKIHTKEFFNTLKGNYPSFLDAWMHVRKNSGVVAFDRQFAVSDGGSVFYKTKAVGAVNRDANSVKHISFHSGYEHLSCLLKG